MGNKDGPVNFLASDSGREPDIGVGVCLSGGGYRAMLFHRCSGDISNSQKLRLLGIAIVVLAIGTMVYLFDRPAFHVAQNFLCKVALPVSYR